MTKYTLMLDGETDCELITKAKIDIGDYVTGIGAELEEVSGIVIEVLEMEIVD